jgi:phosphoribosylanthranilate isomerase
VNESADIINGTAEAAGFDLIQLHGSESPELCAAVERPVIKAVRVIHDASSDQIRRLLEPYQGIVRHVLLDTYSTSLWGGTGESFNWRLARDLSADFSVFLAGGITAANVAEAIETMTPYAIDVSSSLESEPGRKDFDRLAEFFAAFERIAT